MPYADISMLLRRRRMPPCAFFARVFHCASFMSLLPRYFISRGSFILCYAIIAAAMRADMHDAF